MPCEQITWSAAGLAGQSNATTRLSPFCWTASSVVTQTGAVPLRRTASPMAPQRTAGAAASRRRAGSVAPRRPAGASEPRVVRAAAAWRAPRHPPTHPMVGPRACSPVARPSSHRGTRSLAKLTPTRHQPRRPAWQTSVSSSLTRRAPAGPRGPRSGFPGLVRVSPRPGPLSRIWKPGP